MGYFFIGLFISAIYVYVVFCGRTDIIVQLYEMPLNELGDFLAGVFSPLAFLWLLIGYMMQGKELKLNREALKLQAEELSKSVIAQNELVEQSKEQIKLEKEKYETEKENERLKYSSPILKVFFEKDECGKFICYMKNEGGQAKLIKILGFNPKGEPFRYSLLDYSMGAIKVHSYEENPKPNTVQNLVLSYMDFNGSVNWFKLEFTVTEASIDLVRFNPLTANR